MPEYDGQIRIKAGIDTDGIATDIKKLQEELKGQKLDFKVQTSQLQKMREEYENLLNNTGKSSYQIELENQLKNLQIALRNIKKHYEDIEAVETSADGKMSNKLARLGAKYDFIADKAEVIKEKLMNLTTEAAINPVSSKHAQDLAEKIKLAEKNQKQLKNEIDKTSKAIENENQKMSGVVSKISNSIAVIAQKFNAAIFKFGLITLGFNTVTSAIRRLTKGFLELLNKNTAFQTSLAQIRGNLQTLEYEEVNKQIH